MTYAKTKGLLRFFTYCFFGWMWESTYVSVKDRKMTNRGFLRGPWIPIYGFGAMTVLIATGFVRNNVFLVFIVGSLAASVLEYVTGVIMEKIFKVRYWDYSSQPMNLNGHICLKCSIVWGVFSVLIVNFIDPFVSRIIAFVPYKYAGFIATGLLALFVVDIVFSVRDALYLKDIAVKIYDDGILSERAENILNEISVFIRDIPFAAHNGAEEYVSLAFDENAKKKQGSKAAFLEKLDRQKKRKLSFYTYLLEKCDELLYELAKKFPCAQSDREYEKLLEYEYALIAIKESIKKSLSREGTYSHNEYRRAAGIIRRNPSAGSREYDFGLQKLRELSKRSK
ncbi:MAG: hypothetical protein E7218_08045 [Anaerofustis stercorihominis]|nr:hypothetical protein [Anaerofustis stercorihominis]